MRVPADSPSTRQSESMNRALAGLRRVFLAGILITVPTVVTFLALRVLFLWLDGILGPWMTRLLGRNIPGLGLIATLLLILIVGIAATNIIGRRFIIVGEAIFTRVPLVRQIYRTSKEIIEALTMPKRQLFREVVMIEYPRRGLHAYGFVTNYITRHGPRGEERLAIVFLPNPPVPTTGVMVAAPLGDITYLDLSIDDALKLILSAGVVMPADLYTAEGPTRLSESTAGPPADRPGSGKETT